MKYCAKCDKQMTDANGASLIGIVISSVTTDSDFFSKEFLQEQFGKYELDRNYSFCYECWLDSLFGK